MKNRVDATRLRILRRIVKDKTSERQFLASIRELELETGCSRQTVHQALRELAEAGVLEAIPRRGYRLRDAGLAAELLDTADALQIAFVLPRWIENGVASPLFSEILNGAESAEVPGAGVNIVYLTLPWEAGEKTFSLEKLAFKSRRIAGALLVGPTPDFVAEQFIMKCGVPAVLVDNITDLPDATSVSQDNLSGAARAVRYLYQRGHRRIGMISVKPRKMRINERMAGFHAEMHRLGLLDRIAFVEEAAWDADTVTGGAEAAGNLIRRGFGGATAILALNDNMAFGAIRTFREHGIAVPEELSVMGIGNDPRIAEFCTPRLTTMCADMRRLGELGLQALLEKIRRPASGGRITLLSMTLAEGESVADGPDSVIQGETQGPCGAVSRNFGGTAVRRG